MPARKVIGEPVLQVQRGEGGVCGVPRSTCVRALTALWLRISKRVVPYLGGKDRRIQRKWQPHRRAHTCPVRLNGLNDLTSSRLSPLQTPAFPPSPSLPKQRRETRPPFPLARSVGSLSVFVQYFLLGLLFLSFFLRNGLSCEGEEGWVDITHSHTHTRGSERGRHAAPVSLFLCAAPQRYVP